MKASLPERVSSLRERLSLLKGLAANATEAGDLAALRKELAPPASTLSELVQRQSMLETLGVGVTPPHSLAVVRKRAAGIREKFRADRKSSTLKKGLGWTSLLTEAGAALKDVESALQEGWRGFRSQIHAGDTPAVIEKRIARTPGNIQALARYQQAHARFSALFLLPPTSPATVESARQIAAELADIAKTFDFDVSPEVKRFLAAVQAGGAPLSLLTSEVTTWLTDNDAGDGYLIRAADRS